MLKKLTKYVEKIKNISITHKQKNLCKILKNVYNCEKNKKNLKKICRGTSGDRCQSYKAKNHAAIPSDHCEFQMPPY